MDHHFPMTADYPPLFSFFYHLVFEDVATQIAEKDGPIPVDPPSQAEFPRGGSRP
jgi:hypothetical protein